MPWGTTVTEGGIDLGLFSAPQPAFRTPGFRFSTLFKRVAGVAAAAFTDARVVATLLLASLGVLVLLAASLSVS